MSSKVHDLLERKYNEYNTRVFIDSDPVLIPHQFKKQQDIEIAGLFAATLAWGQRKTIMANSKRLMEWMDNAPHQFIVHHQETDLKPFLDFKHRTFNATDVLYFIEFLKEHYKQYSSLEDAFLKGTKGEGRVAKENTEQALINFNEYFFSLEDAPQRTRKHVSTPAKKSTCKRLNMYLRWMVRSDKHGVDFGIWKKIKPSQLLIPLDVHVDRTARQLGLIKSKQTNWQTVLELTENLKVFDPKDPVKYDFALFGLSVIEKANMAKWKI
ncbi:MAG: TIGR02757 family protein [Bacteroidetes bacterium]|nr:TIGR02757 family protein [Bacteroidota bacterium]